MRRIYLPAALLLLVANALIITRMFVADIHIGEMKPTIRYFLSLQMDSVLHGDAATIKAYLPSTGPHQTVASEKIESSRLAYSLITSPTNRRAIWKGDGVTGHETASYEAVVEVHGARYTLPAGSPVPRSYPPDLAPYLEASDDIQSEAPEIADTAARLIEQAGANDISSVIRVLFDFVHEEIDASDYENTLDATTTLAWGEAFCGGKSRLLAALLRASRIPARLVGGLILAPGSKRITHAWVQAWINGVWVPFDALNDHYAEHPGNYLELYYDDHVMFSHTANINFQYRFNVKKWRTAPDESLATSAAGVLNPYVFWDAFHKAHISLNLLRIILMLPIGMLVVVLCRNVVGLTTFGTFHPALIAIAFRDTGLAWGIALYLSVLVLGMLVRWLLDRIELLHTPRVLILLVFVVGFMLAVSYLSVRYGAVEAAHVSLFPIALLTLMVEHFFVKSLELGHWQACAIVVQTLLVVIVTYVVMDSYLAQAVVFAFPEVLLGIVAASLMVGRWTGMRLSEYGRFKLLWAS